MIIQYNNNNTILNMYIDVIICHTSIICDAHYEGLYVNMLQCSI